ncbi:MAG: AMP-binding protein [Bacteroidetes bacterium]|jgi:long-chain-fatty-acid--[acyl-carrier-protein] ligase|nr:AMP-binding protein [Bacteroidota bacterium]
MKTMAALYRLILATRYRVSITGEDLLRSRKPKLFLPNHQAHVDAQILFAQLFKYQGFVPIVSARLLNIPLIKRLFRKLNAVAVGNMQSGKVDKHVIGKMTDSTLEILGKGQNVLIYPSGQLTGQGFEKIFNKSGAYSIVQNSPNDVQIIGVRVSGLWGSMWSKAWTGEIPPILSNLLKGLFYILANLVFFVPKRNVSIEFIDITTEARTHSVASKTAFNSFLEGYYNQQREEEVHYLKHFFYVPGLKRKLPDHIEGSLQDVEAAQDINPNDIPREVQEIVKDIIAKETGVNKELIQLKSNLSLHLNVDSITQVFIISAIENEFGISFNGDYAKIKSVADLCMIALGDSGEQELLKPSTLAQTNEEKQQITLNPEGSIPDHFIQMCSSRKYLPLAYDKMMGSQTRRDFLLKAFVVSELIKKQVKDQHVGIMLPALQSTSLLIMATYLAGKIPVMLNWTVGPKMLQSCMDSARLSRIITASAFFDKVANQLPTSFKDRCLFFDREIKTVSLGMKIKALLKSWMPGKFYKGPNGNQTAVILFTSGSESQPKAVPLTHKNILYNLWGVLKKVDVYNTDILLGFLPPFHSFGFTVLSIMPMVTGVKVAYTPDPTDSKEIARIMAHTKSSVLLVTPTFLNMIMNVSSDEDFNPVRLAITGAESLHPSIANRFKKKTKDVAILLQGYGITECSPILSVTSPETNDLKSVGEFIPGVYYQIIDPESEKPLPNGQEGMIVVRGYSIFNGYLNKDIPSPFLTINDKTYYKTGDLGYIGTNGDLFITGRLKRFIKIAGEMISLPAIENALIEKFGSPDEQVLAVVGDEQREQPKIIVFTKIKMTAEQANNYLKSQGFSNIMRVHEIQPVKDIPLLGTGKTDYKRLTQTVS